MKGIDTFAEPFEELKGKSVVLGIIIGIVALIGLRKVI
jgi:hypothetical protein|tara:strand:+ start:1308 stop:1421 length:114 start_codon:yes stop_codon:yes gene_type:complete